MVTNPFNAPYNFLVEWMRTLEDRLILRAEWPPTVLLNDDPESFEDYVSEIEELRGVNVPGHTSNDATPASPAGTLEPLEDHRPPEISEQHDEGNKQNHSHR